MGFFLTIEHPKLSKASGLTKPGSVLALWPSLASDAEPEQSGCLKNFKPPAFRKSDMRIPDKYETAKVFASSLLIEWPIDINISKIIQSLHCPHCIIVS